MSSFALGRLTLARLLSTSNFLFMLLWILSSIVTVVSPLPLPASVQEMMDKVIESTSVLTIEDSLDSAKMAAERIRQMNLVKGFNEMRASAPTHDSLGLALPKISSQVEAHPNIALSIDSSVLNAVQKMTFQPKFSNLAVYDRNYEYLKNAEDIQMTFSNVDNHMLWEMKKLASFNYGNRYNSAKDPESAAWFQIIKDAGHSSDKQMDIEHAYRERFKITNKDMNAIRSWTDGLQFVISDDLPNALRKIAPFEGIVVRETNLDVETMQELVNSHFNNVPIKMEHFVKNTKLHRKHNGVLDAIMSTYPAGNPLFQPDKNFAKLVIYSRGGRLVGPLSSRKTVIIS